MTNELAAPHSVLAERRRLAAARSSGGFRSQDRTIVETVLYRLALLGCLLSLGCSSQPALESPEALRTAEAMYTAVTSQRLDLLEACAQRIESRAQDGSLSAAAAERLRKIVAQARAKQWQPAAEELDVLLRHQSH